MDFSNSGLQSDEENSNQLVDTLITLTGLPESWVKTELNHIFENHSQNSVESFTLDQLREAMVLYLESIQADFGQADLEQVTFEEEANESRITILK